MTGFKDFIERYQFQKADAGVYYGTYSDMHMVLTEEEGALSACLYLDLPSPGRKARKELEAQLNEKGERYEAVVSPNQDKNGFLKILIKNSEDASVDLDRFLTECDLLLRPYGREMGLLCAYCRKEMQEEKPQYKMENGMVIPVCTACANLSGNAKVKKADNRKTLEEKRMMRGIIGALIGTGISVGIWALASFGGSLLIKIFAAFASVYLIKLLYEKMSRMPTRLTGIFLAVFTMFSMILGSAIGYTVNVNQMNEAMREYQMYEEMFESSNEDEIVYAYEDISVMDALVSPDFYSSIAVSACAVIFASFTSDSGSMRFRRRK